MMSHAYDPPNHLLYIYQDRKMNFFIHNNTEAVPYLYIFPKKAFLAFSRGHRAWSAIYEGLFLGQRPQVLRKSFWHDPNLNAVFMISFEPVPQACPHDWQCSHIQDCILIVIFQLLVGF